MISCLGRKRSKLTVGKLAAFHAKEAKGVSNPNKPQEEGRCQVYNLGGARNAPLEKQCGLIFNQPAYKLNQAWSRCKQWSLMYKTVKEPPAVRSIPRHRLLKYTQLASQAPAAQG